MPRPFLLLKTSLLCCSWCSRTQFACALIVVRFDCRLHCFVHTFPARESPPHCSNTADKLQFRKTHASKQTQISSIFLVKEKFIRCNFFLWGQLLQTLQLSLWKISGNSWQEIIFFVVFFFKIYMSKSIYYAYIGFANKICWCLQNYRTVVQMPATTRRQSWIVLLADKLMLHHKLPIWSFVAITHDWIQYVRKMINCPRDLDL